MKTEITKELLRAMREDINAALKAVAEKHKVSIEAGHASFTAGGTFTFKLEGLANGGKSIEAQRYESSIALLNLPPLGTDVELQGKAFVTTGLNTTGTKVLLARLSDRKEFQIPTSTLLRIIAAKAAA